MTGISDFTKKDIDEVDEAVTRFTEIRGERGVLRDRQDEPKLQAIYSIALFKSQRRLERLTWAIICLTVVLAAVTVLSVILLFVQ